MTSTLGTDLPLTGFITDDFEGDQVAGRVPPETGLQLPYLDLDDQGFTWPAHPPVGLPPFTPLVPADRLSTDEPDATFQLKRDRNALRGQADDDAPHAAPAPAATGDTVPAELPTRRSLRRSRAEELPVVRTFIMSQPTVVPDDEVPKEVTVPTAVELPEVAPAPATEALADAASVPDVDALEVADEDSGLEHMALAEDLESALLAAIAASPEAEEPSPRALRLTCALALANGEPVDDLPAGEAGADSEYMSMMKSYGPFPLLLPEHRDFRPVLTISVLAGFLGADRFYEGKHITGALKLATAGGLGIWWIADIVAILSGRASDKDGRHFRGEKKHRVAAWVLTAAMFAGLTPVAVNLVTPVATAATEAVNEALFPKPAPVPAWATLTEVARTPEPIILNVTGDRLRLTYNFPAPVYAYLQKVGDNAVPAEALLLRETLSEGEKEVAITPGKYQLVIRTEGAWTAKVEELALHG
jgi:hypothetical protein